MKPRILPAGNKGFTLIELVVVLLLIGIASSVVIVSLANEHKKSIIKYEARRLYAALKHSRELAIARHSEVVFSPDEENGEYSLSSSEKSILTRVLPEGITLRSEEILFYPIGDSSGGEIFISDEDGREYRITVSHTTGKAKIERVQSS